MRILTPAIVLATASQLCGCAAALVGSDLSGPPRIPTGLQQAVKVRGAPPPLRGESAPACKESETVLPGTWVWADSAWHWSTGACVQAPRGYLYIWPAYADGTFTPGYWSRSTEDEGPRQATPGPIREAVAPAADVTEASTAPRTVNKKKKRRGRGRSETVESGPTQIDSSRGSDDGYNAPSSPDTSSGGDD